MAEVTKELDPATLQVVQLRTEKLDPEYVRELAEVLKANGKLPACEAFKDSANVVRIWDGAHRVEAHRQCGKRVEVRVRAGEERDALLAAAGANQRHGLRRTNDVGGCPNPRSSGAEREQQPEFGADLGRLSRGRLQGRARQKRKPGFAVRAFRGRRVVARRGWLYRSARGACPEIGGRGAGGRRAVSDL